MTDVQFQWSLSALLCVLHKSDHFPAPLREDPLPVQTQSRRSARELRCRACTTTHCSVLCTALAASSSTG